jgi:hypothetical protein
MNSLVARIEGFTSVDEKGNLKGAHNLTGWISITEARAFARAWSPSSLPAHPHLLSRGLKPRGAERLPFPSLKGITLVNIPFLKLSVMIDANANWDPVLDITFNEGAADHTQLAASAVIRRLYGMYAGDRISVQVFQADFAGYWGLIGSYVGVPRIPVGYVVDPDLSDLADLIENGRW